MLHPLNRRETHFSDANSSALRVILVSHEVFLARVFAKPQKYLCHSLFYFKIKALDSKTTYADIFKTGA